MLAADGADDVLVLGDELVHLVKAHGIDVHFGVLVADELVGTVTCLAGAAVQQRVREARHMAGGDPGLRIHDDGCIQAHVVGALLHELLQPCFLDVVLELDAQRAVIPAVGKTAIDLRTGEHVTTVLAEVDDHIKGLFALFHCNNILSVRGWLAVSCVVLRQLSQLPYIFMLPCFARSVNALRPQIWGPGAAGRYLWYFMPALMVQAR